MNRATHTQTAGVDRILLEGVADGRPFKERNWHHKQPVYLAPTVDVPQFVFGGFQADYSQLVDAELSLADLGYPFSNTSETFAGWVDFTFDLATVPAKVSALETDGQIALSTFDSILLESPPSGALAGGPSLATAAVPGDIDLTGTNLTDIAPVESKLIVVEPGRIDGTDTTASRAFGAPTKYLFVRNFDWQAWLRIPFNGTLTAAACVAAINDAVAQYAQSVGKLRPMFPPRGSWDAGFYPNIFAVTPAPGGAANTIGLFAHGEASRIEVASVAATEAVVGGGNSANVLLLGLGTGALSDTGAGTRGTVVHADITHGGTTMTVGAGNVPGGTAIGDIIYLSINGRDLHVTITS